MTPSVDMAFSSSAYLLSWSEVVERRGPGRKTALLGNEVYNRSQVADLLVRLEQLLLSGFEVRVRPPRPSTDPAHSGRGPVVIDAEASAA